MPKETTPKPCRHGQQFYCGECRAKNGQHPHERRKALALKRRHDACWDAVSAICEDPDLGMKTIKQLGHPETVKAVKRAVRLILTT